MLDKRRFLIGQYHPGSGLLYRLDARTKVIMVLMIMVAALIATIRRACLIRGGVFMLDSSHMCKLLPG